MFYSNYGPNSYTAFVISGNICKIFPRLLYMKRPREWGSPWNFVTAVWLGNLE